MAAKTLYMTNSLLSGIWQEMSETAPATAMSSPNTGWTLGKSAANFTAMLDAQTEAASGSFTSGLRPGTSIVTTAGAGNALRSTNPYTGLFEAGTWTLTFDFRSVTTAATGSVRVRCRVWRSVNADSSSAVDILGADQVGTATGALSTTVDATSVVTISMPQVTLNNEYLFITIALEIITASGSNTADAILRIGSGTTRVVTSNFIFTAPLADSAGGSDALSISVVRSISTGGPGSEMSNVITTTLLASGYWKYEDTSGSAVAAVSTPFASGNTYTNDTDASRHVFHDTLTDVHEGGFSHKFIAVSGLPHTTIGGGSPPGNPFGGRTSYTYFALYKVTSTWKGSLVQLWSTDSAVTAGQVTYDAVAGTLSARRGTATGSYSINLADGLFHRVVMRYDGTVFTVFLDGQIVIQFSNTTSASSGSGALIACPPKDTTVTGSIWVSRMALWLPRILSDGAVAYLDRAVVFGAEVGDLAPATDTATAVVSVGPINRGTSDDASAAETITRAAVASRGLADTADATEAGTRSVVVARTVSDSSPASEAVTKATSFPRAVGDSSPASESAARQTTQTRQIADTSGATEAVTCSEVLARSTSDTAGATENVVRQTVQSRSAPDTAPASGAEIHSVSKSAPASDSAPATEVVARQVVQVRMSADIASVTDSVTRSAVYTRAIGESGGATEGETHSGVLLRSVADSTPATDAATRFTSANRSIADSAPASSTINTTSGLAALGSDAAPASENVSRTIVATRMLGETIALSDSVSANTGASASTVDSSPASDAVSRVGSFSRGTADSITGDDSLSRAVAHFILITDNAPGADGSSGSSGGTIGGEEGAPADPSASRSVIYWRSIFDTTTMGDSVVVTSEVLPGSGIPGHFGDHSPGHHPVSVVPGQHEDTPSPGHTNPASPGRRDNGNVRDC